MCIRDRKITIIKERTNWYRIRVTTNNHDELEGWIKKQDIAKLSELNGQQLTDTPKGFEGYLERNFEVSLYGGLLDDITSLSGGVTWVWTKNLALDINYSQAFGDTSDIDIYSIRIRQTIFPSWKLSPYVAVGTGRIRTEPNVNLVQSGDESRTNSHFETGLGLRYFLRESVLLNMEYRSILALTDRDEQERIDQWLIGVSVYF